MTSSKFSLAKYLNTNQIVISPEVYKACVDGLYRMSKSPDPIHTHKHIIRMLNDLSQMRKEDHQINWRKINFSVLLLAIVWHDIWKGRRITKSKKKLIYDTLYEGLGSMRIFSKEARRYGINTQIFKKARYAIRKHSYLQFLPRMTPEAKILKSLDELEDLSIERLKDMLDSMHNFSLLTPGLASLFRLYIQHLVRRKNGYGHNNSWSKKEYQRRKKYFFDNIWPTLKNYLKFFSPTSPLPHPSLLTGKQTICPENAK